MRLTLVLRWKMFDKSGLLENILEQIFYVASINQGIFPLHATAIAKGNRAFLIVGQTGSDKTSLSTFLCLKEKFSWVADDQCFLSRNEMDEISIAVAYDLISLRKTSYIKLKKYIPISSRPEIEQRFSLEAYHQAKSNPPLKPEELSLQITELPCQVRAIFFPQLTDNYKYISKASPKLISTLIFQEFVKSLYGIGSYILDNAGRVVHPPIIMEPRDGWSSICEFVNILAINYPAYIVNGSLNDVAKFIVMKSE